MLNPLTQISRDAHSIFFINETAHGAQKIEIVMSLVKPMIVATTVAIVGGKIVTKPLAMTEEEVKEFFTKARVLWGKK